MNFGKLKETIFSIKNQEIVHDKSENINNSIIEGINPTNEPTESNPTGILPILTQKSYDHFLSLPNSPNNKLTKNTTEIDRYKYLPKVFYWNRERLQGSQFNKLNIVLGTIALGLIGITGNSIHNENTLSAQLKQDNNVLANSNKIEQQATQVIKANDQKIQSYKSKINKDQSLLTTVGQNNISLKSNLNQTKIQLNQAEIQQQTLIAQNQANLKNAEFQKVSEATDAKFGPLTVTQQGNTFYAHPTPGSYYGNCATNFQIQDPNTPMIYLSSTNSPADPINAPKITSFPEKVWYLKQTCK